MKIVTANTFESDVLKSDKPVLVDFGAEWCGPCKAFKPVLEAYAAENGIEAVYVDVDESNQIASQFHVMAVPTLGFFKGGQMVDRRAGNMPKSVLDEFVKKNLS